MTQRSCALSACRLFAIAASAAVGLSHWSTLHADTKYNWQVAANGYWSDDVTLQGAGNARSSLAFEVAPRFHLQQESDLLRSRLDYGLSYITYTEKLGQQQAFHDLDAAAELSVIPQWIYLPASVKYSQALIDPTGPGSYGGGLLGAGNLSDVASYRVSPRIDHKTNWGGFSAEYTYGEVNFSDAALASAVDTGVVGIVSLGDPESSLAGRLAYVAQETEYEIGRKFRFDSALAEAGYRVIRDLRLIGQIGLESDIETTVSGGGLDRNFWRGGFEWQATRNDRFSLLVGRRFFGTTYEGSWLRQMRYLELKLDYREDPTTQSRQFSLRPFEFGVAEGRNAGVPGSQGFGRLSSDAFLSKRLDGNAVLTGRLTTLALRLSSERREYFIAPSEDVVSELSISVERRLGPSLSIGLGLDRQNTNLREGRSYSESRFSVRASRQFGRALSATAEASRVNRTGDLRDYDVTWFRVGILKKFGEE